MKMKKFLALLTAGALLCPLLTGCQYRDTEPVTKTGLYTLR